MNILQGCLTELEGAILSEIHHRGASTAFKVRKAFQASMSLEWRGSAGAVYPAIHRLTARGVIDAAETGSGRRTNLLSLTPQGVAMLEDWICDASRAASVGLDPFRLRAGMWAQLPAKRRNEGLTALRRVVEAEVVAMQQYLLTLDPVERPRIELAIGLQISRLAWLDQQTSRQA
ncbi:MULTISPECIES: PadR family transcriptional regulator [Brevundimonas]|uniref:PadR family transcriptional regulator n=1 Tax=Brevundimonas TaxID=41275 RepID=UPI000FAD51CA|nr:PadR family transcriptional regulator [Brevundimonas sp. P7753]NWE53523.1 PadR family transcriptional regulator [Brevundimonas sp. P7753]